MAMSNTQDKILDETQHLFAIAGTDGIGMRAIAKHVGIVPSVIYHYYPTKDELLLQMYLRTNKQLGEVRAQLPELSTFEEQLKQRIAFQLDNAEPIVAVLKYYLLKRKDFQKNSRGHLPEKTYLHIEEILEWGVKNNIFDKHINIEKESKVIVHAINGFILEYFPSEISEDEKNELVETISDFILRALEGYRKK